MSTFTRPPARLIHTTAQHLRIGHDIFEFRCLRFGYQVRLIEDAMAGPWAYGLTLTQGAWCAQASLDVWYQQAWELLEAAEQAAREWQLDPSVGHVPQPGELLF